MPAGRFLPTLFTSDKKTVPLFDYHAYRDWQYVSVEASGSSRHFVAVANRYGAVANQVGSEPSPNHKTHSYIFEWKPSFQHFVEFQTIVTRSANKFETWKHNGDTFLIVTNTKDHSSSYFKTDHPPVMSYLHDDCYKFNAATNQFVPVYHILSHHAQFGGGGYTALLLNGRVFLANAVRQRYWDANRYVWGVNAGAYANDYVIDSVIFEVGATQPVGFSLTKLHELPIQYSSSIEAFDIDGKVYLLAGSHLNHDYAYVYGGHDLGYTRHNLEAGYQSQIWRYDGPAGTVPVVIQSLVQEGVNLDWTYFSMGPNHYIVSAMTMTIERNSKLVAFTGRCPGFLGTGFIVSLFISIDTHFFGSSSSSSSSSSPSYVLSRSCWVYYIQIRCKLDAFTARPPVFLYTGVLIHLPSALIL